VVVGTGIQAAGQMTLEAVAWIQRADRVVYVVSDPVGESVLRSLNPRSESLRHLYAPERPRTETYEQMVEYTLDLVRGGHMVCFAAYGHPGVFAYPTHEAVRRARAEGYVARMLPGISAEDCLVADLGVDPATSGCQSFEATDFLLNGRILDPTCHVLLWQIGALGEPNGRLGNFRPKGLPLLIARLCKDYPDDHPAILYEAPTAATAAHRSDRVALADLSEAAITATTTLYLAPASEPCTDWDLAEKLGYERPRNDGDS
jgi:precorrin-6B methylase 1